MRYEVQDFGVQVSLTKPGGVYTNFISVADANYPAAIPGGPYHTFRKNFLAMTTRMFESGSSYGILTPEQVAAVIVEAATARRPRSRYRVGTLAKVMPKIRHLLSDSLWDWMMRAQVPTR